MPEAARDESLADDFWAYSLALYSRPAVAAACLRLQDAHGLDVNLLLLCCWLARSGRGRLSAATLAAAEARVAPWCAGVVVPLREIRRALKILPQAGAPALYREVQRLELVAEREEQRLLLAGWAGSPAAASDPAADCAANLALYVAAHELPIDLTADLINAVEANG
jgi:uncharacterized protein (TIGR02444 family)